MKARLNLTIDSTLLDQMKGYAVKKQISISELVENYFKSIARPVKRKNFISMVEKLEKPSSVKDNVDLKEAYYQEKAKKHGF